MMGGRSRRCRLCCLDSRRDHKLLCSLCGTDDAAVDDVVVIANGLAGVVGCAAFRGEL